MTAVSLWLSQLWDWVVWGNAQLRHVAYYATMITFLGVVWQLLLAWRQSRRVRVFVVNADNPEERAPVGTLPRRYVTRAEINGVVSQAAGGEKLDFSRFRFDYKIRRSIDVPLPQPSYLMVIGAHRQAQAASDQGGSSHDATATAPAPVT